MRASGLQVHKVIFGLITPGASAWLTVPLAAPLHTGDIFPTSPYSALFACGRNFRAELGWWSYRIAFYHATGSLVPPPLPLSGHRMILLIHFHTCCHPMCGPIS
ncbi:hypothetical protein N7468_002682 [Penicillium chermesinum]|uniref:Uncharacterized protein n=1 Tax=Penicillium chermesinum TaxID=63820 RepID=A0A9W9PIY7_9EURO|nr:uncharacterized protein N7468_002682 [Penicillium chermesinum]KAJ5247699.1 hypothetical protein N7468_002682 [Penicillium chermesinum]